MTPIAPISPVFNKLSPAVSNLDWKNKATNPIHSKKITPAELAKSMPWLKDKAIVAAIAELHDLQFSKDDIEYLKNIGVNVPFKTGADAVHFIQKQNIRIIFDQTTEANIHAQYDFGKNIVTINNRYKNTNDFGVILAISEAILHEAGHAKDNDGESSIQEELEFLGMNAIAHRAYLDKYGNIFNDSPEPIVKDGVSVYAKLFFENDPDKKNLINRISEKYGDLPTGDRIHPPGDIARTIKRKYLADIPA